MQISIGDQARAVSAETAVRNAKNSIPPDQSKVLQATLQREQVGKEIAANISRTYPVIPWLWEGLNKRV